MAMQADTRIGWLMQQGDQSYTWMPIMLPSDESPWRLLNTLSKTTKRRAIYISKGAKSLGSPWGAKAQSPEFGALPTYASGTSDISGSHRASIPH